MSIEIEKILKKTLPVIFLQGQVIFPGGPLTLELSQAEAIENCLWADEHDSEIFILGQKELVRTAEAETFSNDIGIIAAINQVIKLPDGNIRISAEGFSRGKAIDYVKSNDKLFAEVMIKNYFVSPDQFETGAKHRILSLFEELCLYIPRVSREMVEGIKKIDDLVFLMDSVASNALFRFEDKIAVLGEFDPMERYNIFIDALEREIFNLKTESELHKKVRVNVDQGQREYYLKEQLKVIQDELGYEEDDEINEYLTKIKELIDDEKQQEKLIKEANKLAKIPFGAAEGTVIHNYLDTVLEYPWKKQTTDTLDLNKAKKILDADHEGIVKVKERVLEYLAVKKLNGGKNPQILCLVGAPGVGKTSVAGSIAKAMGRKFVRVSLGGVRDEAEIRGHRKTYLGSMPGRIVAAITEAGVENPLILLDEIDKLTMDTHGDPSSALLEVLDAEQNKNFRDHFMEIPIDLSKCVFIATANTLETVQRPLIDRMEIIEMQAYTREEKLSIAKKHLFPKQLERAGLQKGQLKITDQAILTIIDTYTAEAGVRGLERCMAAICRKGAVKLLEGAEKVSVNNRNLKEFLDEPLITNKKVTAKGRIGIVNGMAYTQTGGDLLEVEAIALPGTGRVILTGSLGDVMKESANIAISYIRSIAKDLGIRESFYRDTDIHVHFPEGAVPKDGPSAGVTMTTAIVSQLTGCAVRGDIAMTGEISLKGKVLPIGGLREKTMAAYKAGVTKILVPKENENAMCQVADSVKEHVEFVFCEQIEDVLRHAIILEGIEEAEPAKRKRMAALSQFVRNRV
ncbi:MAG: endopeptidase La [Clostridiales bacterium]|nr:endopeptidase La [Clostridiales bacterium]